MLSKSLNCNIKIIACHNSQDRNQFVSFDTMCFNVMQSHGIASNFVALTIMGDGLYDFVMCLFILYTDTRKMERLRVTMQL